MGTSISHSMSSQTSISYHVITNIKKHSIASSMHTKDISHLRRDLDAFGVESEQKYSQTARQSEQHSMQCPVAAEINDVSESCSDSIHMGQNRLRQKTLFD